MTVTDAQGSQSVKGGSWYSRSAEQVAADLGVDPAVGLSAARAGDLLARNGPNALPEEKAKPGWRRFAEQYRSYMQIILVVAAIVSLLIKEWSTGVLLILITILNAVVGLRQEGKAESAMNALKAMVKASARVRRDDQDDLHVAGVLGEEALPARLRLLLRQGVRAVRRQQFGRPRRGQAHRGIDVQRRRHLIG